MLLDRIWLGVLDNVRPCELGWSKQPADNDSSSLRSIFLAKDIGLFMYSTVKMRKYCVKIACDTMV